VKKKPPSLSDRVKNALAAGRTMRTRLYGALGHKHLDDSPDFSAELYGAHKRIDDECKKVARLLHKIRVRKEEVTA